MTPLNSYKKLGIDNSLLIRYFPWGSLFATRSNYEYDFFEAERQLVHKYLRPQSTVLVLGAGNGREGRPIANMCKKVFCLDIGMAYLLSGQKLCAAEQILNISFICATVTGLPFKEKTFDFIFFSLYSAVREKRFGVIRDIVRLLRPSGLILFMTLTSEIIKMRPFKNDIIFDDINQLQHELASCGLKIIENKQDIYRPEYRFSILRPVAK